MSAVRIFSRQAGRAFLVSAQLLDQTNAAVVERRARIIQERTG